MHEHPGLEGAGRQTTGVHHGVRDRIRRLTGEEKPVQVPAERQARLDELRRRIEAVMDRRPAVPTPARPLPGPLQALEDLVCGEDVRNEAGRCYCVRTRHAETSAHGRHLIRDLAGLDMATVSLLAGDARLAVLSARDALFLDTETTGLAGGSGTLAFMVGLGWFEGQDFVTVQLFARDFSEEPALLDQVHTLAQGRRFLVTFNGRAFDVNLLASRFILNRRPDPLSDLPHLDLLPPSRRLSGQRLENCRLVTLEEHLLGLKRTGDVPGQLIPQRYFAWLRHRDARLVADIFEHNRLDIVSMAALVSHLSAIMQGHPQAHPVDLLAAAKLHHDRGNLPQARLLCEYLLAGNPLANTEACALLSLIHKREGNWELAVPLWEALLASDPHDLLAVEELAKVLEHRLHDYERARVLVTQALPHAPADRQAGLRHRLKRLSARCERKQSPGV